MPAVDSNIKRGQMKPVEVFYGTKAHIRSFTKKWDMNNSRLILWQAFSAPVGRSRSNFPMPSGLQSIQREFQLMTSWNWSKPRAGIYLIVRYIHELLKLVWLTLNKIRNLLPPQGEGNGRRREKKKLFHWVTKVRRGCIICNVLQLVENLEEENEINLPSDSGNYRVHSQIEGYRHMTFNSYLEWRGEGDGPLIFPALSLILPVILHLYRHQISLDMKQVQSR